MSASKKPKKLRLDDKSENVSPPWQAWWHPDKKRKFYTNTQTKESIWDHPDSEKSQEAIKQKTESRKRKDVVVKNYEPAGDERMEIDMAPPPKRKSTEVVKFEEFTPKRSRRSISVDIAENRHQSPSSSTSDKILPLVTWSSEIRPFNRIPYRACAIFDTCALIENPKVLDDSVEKQILTVIPYAVLSELDGLKNVEKTRREASRVSNRLKDLQEQKNYYLHIETSVEQQIQINGYRPNDAVKDDFILKCALRIKKEVLSISSILNLNDRAVLLVTNDTVLSNKAMTHELTVETVQTFIDIIHGREKKLKISDRKSNNIKNSLDNERSEKSEKTAVSSGNYRKSIAVERVKKQREVKEWINELAQKDASRHANCVVEKPTKMPSKPRPSIPLADEISPSLVSKPVKPIRSYNPSTYNTYQIKKPVKSIETVPNRPQMPLSLSDEETVAGDEMDCS